MEIISNLGILNYFNFWCNECAKVYSHTPEQDIEMAITSAEMNMNLILSSSRTWAVRE